MFFLATIFQWVFQSSMLVSINLGSRETKILHLCKYLFLGGRVLRIEMVFFIGTSMADKCLLEMKGCLFHIYMLFLLLFSFFLRIYSNKDDHFWLLSFVGYTKLMVFSSCWAAKDFKSFGFFKKCLTTTHACPWNSSVWPVVLHLGERNPVDGSVCCGKISALLVKLSCRC